MTVEARRVYVGGLPPNVGEDDLNQRFSKFGEVSGIAIKTKKDTNGEVTRTFAHMTFKTDEADWRKCLNTYNKTRWKGHELIIQEAKENFLDRLQKERENTGDGTDLAEKDEAKTEMSPPPLVVKGAVPGTLVEGKKDWVVGKYGTVLPVVNVKRKDNKKVMKVDPSKYVHNVKKMDRDGKEDGEDVAVSHLTWQVGEEDSEMTRKRKGIFPEYTPKKKERKVVKQYKSEEINRENTTSFQNRYLANDESALETVPLSYRQGQKSNCYDSDDSRDSADTDEIISSVAKKKKESKKPKKTSLGKSPSGKVTGKLSAKKSKVHNPKSSSSLTMQEEDSSDSATSCESASVSLPGAISIVKQKQMHNGKGGKHGKRHSVSQSTDSDSSPDTDDILDKSHTKFKSDRTDMSIVSDTAKSNRSVSKKNISDSSDSSEEDILDQIASKKFSEKKVINKVVKAKTSINESPDANSKKGGEVKEKKTVLKTSKDTQEKKLKKAKSPAASSSPSKTSATHVRDKAQHELDNKKRLDSLLERQKEAKSQKDAIKKALSSVDNSENKKKIVFDSDDEDEMLNSSQPNTAMQQKENKNDEQESQKKPSLFQSDSSSSSDGESEGMEDKEEGEVSDQEMFRIRPEYEGEAGRKLMKLQSRFGQDRRFKMDQRFLESDSEEAEEVEKSTNEIKKGPSEREKNLQILKSIVGGKAETKQQKKHFKDISTLHYDPTRDDHSQFELKPETTEGTTKPKDKKKKKKCQEVEEEPVEPVPEVSKDRFYEVTSSLKDVFGADSNQAGPTFSLLTQFGSKAKTKDEMETKNTKGTKGEVPSALFGWKKDVKDSSDEEMEEDTPAKELRASTKNEKEVKPAEEKHRTFFMKADDPRIKEGINFFYRSEDMETLRAKWEKIHPTIRELSRLRRKRALRRQKANENQHFNTKKKFSFKR